MCSQIPDKSLFNYLENPTFKQCFSRQQSCGENRHVQLRIHQFCVVFSQQGTQNSIASTKCLNGTAEAEAATEGAKSCISH